MVHNRKITSNLMGLCFLTIQDTMINIIMGLVMQVPKGLLVLRREVANKMYSPTVYYFSEVTVCILTFRWYPIALTSLSIWFYGLQVMDFAGWCEWLGVITATTFVASAFGFSIGCVFPEFNTAQIVVVQFINFFNMGAGFMTNNADPNLFVRFATWVSPMHYSCELLFRRILKGRRPVI